MKKILISLFLTALILSFCSRDKENTPSPRVPVHEKNEPMASSDDRPSMSLSEKSSLQIKAVSLVPETPTVLTDVSAVPELAGSLMEGGEFQYQWYINGKQVEEFDGEKLEKFRFKKGAWLSCKVKAVADGEESDWFKSDIIRVLNSLPVFEPNPVAKIDVPGDFIYTVAASDPDNDPVTFELVSPLDKGIVFNSKSGVLSWRLTEETVASLGEKIDIKLVISDGEGEKVEGTITLTFTRAKQTR